MGKMIYLDNAATTKTAPEVVQAMLPYFSEYYGNPSSIYDFAGKSKEAVTKGREQIAEVLGAKKEEIFFPCSLLTAHSTATVGSIFPDPSLLNIAHNPVKRNRCC